MFTVRLSCLSSCLDPPGRSLGDGGSLRDEVFLREGPWVSHLWKGGKGTGSGKDWAQAPEVDRSQHYKSLWGRKDPLEQLEVRPTWLALYSSIHQSLGVDPGKGAAGRVSSAAGEWTPKEAGSCRAGPQVPLWREIWEVAGHVYHRLGLGWIYVNH